MFHVCEEAVHALGVRAAGWWWWCSSRLRNTSANATDYPHAFAEAKKARPVQKSSYSDTSFLGVLRIFFVMLVLTPFIKSESAHTRVQGSGEGEGGWTRNELSSKSFQHNIACLPACSCVCVCVHARVMCTITGNVRIVHLMRMCVYPGRPLVT
jgi:hypothetical protein